MDSTITHKHFQLKKNVPDIRPGDRVKVHQEIKEGNKTRVQIFEGLVIKTQHGNGINGTFTVRRISLGVGVEKNFPLHLPSIVKIEKVRSAKVRRAKLYYVRELIGRKARRLKKEKEDKKVWEDIIVTNDSEKDEIEKTEGSEEKSEKTSEQKEGKKEPESKPEPEPKKEEGK